MPGKQKTKEEEKVDLLGQLSVKLDVEYTLRPSRRAISAIERALGKSLPQLVINSGSIGLSLEELGICVCELMKAYGAANPNAGLAYMAPDPQVVADLIYDAGQGPVVRRLAVIFAGALTGGYTASGEPKAAGTKTTEPTPTAD